jgi:hypothetical protein
MSTDRAGGAGDWGEMMGKPRLTCAEGDDAANRVVGRDAHRYPIAWHDFDAEPPHAATELGQHFVAGITLHTVEAAAMHRDDGTLDVDEIVLTQSMSFLDYASIVPHQDGIGKHGGALAGTPRPRLYILSRVTATFR